MTDWKPIETAPKDGTFILVFDGQWTNVVAWDDDLKHTSAPSQWANYNRFGIDAVENPTHWMPLPEAPGIPS